MTPTIKNPPSMQKTRVQSELGRSPGEVNVFLPDKTHGQSSLVGYSPKGCKRVRHGLVTKQQLNGED